MNQLLPSLLFLFGFIFSGNSFAQSVSNDLTFNPDDIGFDYGKGCDGRVRVSVIQPDGKIIIAGDFTSVNGSSSPLVRLNTDGSIDTSFHTSVLTSYGIYDLKIQPDGKIIVAGEVSALNYGRIIRLNADGSLDPTFFMNGSINDIVKTVAIQPDGKVIIGGLFDYIWGQNKSHIARLNTDGTLDASFIASGTHTSGDVHTCTVQADGKILVGGWFNTMNGSPASRLARLNPDGSLDVTFQMGTGVAGIVYKTAELSDGKLLVSGNLLTYNGANCTHIIRLLSDGTRDTTFHPENALMADAGHRVVSFAVQPDNKIVIGGTFHLVSSSGNTNQYLARLEPDGTEDMTFVSAEANAEVATCSLQPDGKLIIGGDFTHVGGIRKNYIARVKGDGLQDSTFNWGLGIDGMVFASALQPDGKIILAGNFARVNGHACSGIVRLESNGQVDTGFSPVNMPGDFGICLLQPDGKILVAVKGYMYIMRLNEDGTMDSTFSSPFADYVGGIYTCSLYPDGRIFVGGDFHDLTMGIYTSAARLLPNGDFDSGFYLGSGANDIIRTSAIQSDSSVIVGGDFTQINNLSRAHLAKLLPDGALDPNYIVTISGPVQSCDLQPDGKLIIGGYFLNVNGVPHRVLARINQYGILDASFQTEANLFGQIAKIKVLADGKILVCGTFSTQKYLQLHSLVRFQSNGELDYTFNTGNGPNSLWVNTFEIQPNEKIIAAGGFTAFDEVGRNRITRLEVCESSIGPDTTVIECNSFTWTNGQTYYVSGNYLRILPNYQGCDSILLLNLTLNHTNSTSNATACGSYTWTNGQTYTQTGNYTQTLVNAVGCDSIANLNLTILQKPDAVVQNNNDGTLTALANYGQWIDCGTNLPIPGATDALFAPSQNGSYAFILTLNNGCSDTSDCVTIMDLGIESYSDQEFAITPNPTNDQVHISFSGSDAELTVYDVQGKVVLKAQIQNQETVSLENFERGVYLFDFKNSTGHSIQRVVKQ